MWHFSVKIHRRHTWCRSGIAGHTTYIRPTPGGASRIQVYQFCHGRIWDFEIHKFWHYAILEEIMEEFKMDNFIGYHGRIGKTVEIRPGSAWNRGKMRLGPVHRRDAMPTLASHANLSPTTRNGPFSVLGFWDKNTGICAGAMPYRRDFTATARI